MRYEKTTVQKTNKMIRLIRRRKTFDNLSFYNFKEDKSFYFYFDINGFYKKKYFHIVIRHGKIHGGEIIEIVNTTDCKEDVKKMLSKYGLTTNTK